MRETDADIKDIPAPENGLGHYLPTQTISFSDSHGVHSFTLSPAKRLALVASGILLAVWGVIATVTVLINSSADNQMRLRSAALTLAYETRLEELLNERDLLSTQLANTTERMMNAQGQLMAQQESILQIGAERQEMDAEIGAIQNASGWS